MELKVKVELWKISSDVSYENETILAEQAKTREEADRHLARASYFKGALAAYELVLAELEKGEK